MKNETVKQGMEEGNRPYRNPAGVEEELEEILSIVFQASPAPMSVTRVRDGVIVDVNRAWERATGLAREDAVGRTTEALDLFVDGGDRRKIFRELAEKGSLVDFATRLRNRNGHEAHVIISATLIRRAGEQYLLGVAQDITEQKRLEEVLRTSEARYRVIVENTNDAIFINDFEGNISDVNENTCRMLGYSREDLIGAGIAGIDPEWVLPLRGDVKRLVEDGAGVLERRNIRKDGSEIAIEVSARIISREGKGLAVSFARDVTDRKRMAQALQESEALYRTALESSNDGVVIARDSRYVYVNQTFLDRIGRTRDEMLGTVMGTNIHPDDQAAFMDAVDRFNQGQAKQRHIETRVLKPDGLCIHFEVSPVEVIFGGERCILAYLRDITDRKEAEKALKEILDNLDATVRERTLQLSEANSALRYLLKQREEDRKILEEKLQLNIDQLVLPALDELASCGLNARGMHYLDLLKANLREIASPFLAGLSSMQGKLTPREAQVANMIREGKKSKEIAEMLGTSKLTVDRHRINIRKKLSLSGEKINLQSHLLSVK